MSKYEIKGKWYTINQLSEISGIAAHTIRDRLRRGFSIEEAIKPVATHTSVKEFGEASWYEDWIGMTMDELYKIYWHWCISYGYTPMQKQGFSRQLIKMYPMVYTVPTKTKDGTYRVIRRRY